MSTFWILYTIALVINGIVGLLILREMLLRDARRAYQANGDVTYLKILGCSLLVFVPIVNVVMCVVGLLGFTIAYLAEKLDQPLIKKVSE